MKTTEENTMHVYLVNGNEFICADSPEQARAFYATSEIGTGDDPPYDAKEKDDADYFDDGYNTSRNDDRTCSMIEQARKMISEGSVIPFSVAVHFDLL